MTNAFNVLAMRRLTCASLPVRVSCFFRISKIGFRISAAAIAALSIVVAVADEPQRLELHEWSVWATEANQNLINAQAGFASALPGLVDSMRGRRADPDRPDVTPLSMIFFSGKPTESVDLSLRMTGGRFLAHWPSAETKNNRLAWNDLKLTAPVADAPYGFVPEGHWFNQARQLDGLTVQRGSRVERFIAYDTELNFPLSLRVDKGPDRYQVINAGKYSLKDVLLVAPAAGGRRIGWIDDLAAPKNPVPVKVAAAPGSSSGAVAQALDAVKAATAQVRAAAAPDAPAASSPATAQQGVEKPAEGKWYKLVHVETGKTLGIAGNSDVDAAQAELAPDESNDSRRWKVEFDGEHLKLVNYKSDKALDVQQESKSEGAAIIQWPDKSRTGDASTLDNQRWSWEGKGAERRIKNRLSDMVLDVDDSGKIIQRASDPKSKRQLWRFVEVKEEVKDKSAEAMVEVQMSAPLNDEQLKAQAIAPLRTRLVAAGLKESEADLLLSLYSKAFFQSREPVLIVRLPQSTIDEWLPLEIDPDSAKIARVALVICYKIDPQIRDEVKQLVEQLADNDYNNREKAERRLRDLGRMAIPALKEAVKSPDPERVMRAERLLLRQNERLDGR
jgi:hypothetical protein